MPVVAIVGRPNVGKSALFNRLVQRRVSLVDATPGLTRDRIYGDVRWRGTDFRLVDTGGLEFSSGDRMQKEIEAQVALAAEEAALVLFVCDGRDGLLPLDRQVADWIRPRGKPVIVVANKLDGEFGEENAHEFSALGMGLPWPVSSLHGLGVGELLDAVAGSLPPSQAPAGEQAQIPVRIAIVGRPNVGKSSLLNRILRQDRVLVDDRPGTTRDPVEAEFSYQDRRFCWIDTAGVRARKTVRNRMEAVARMKSVEVIASADVCVGVLEAPQGILRDDLRLFDEVVTAGKPLCLAVNKWDLIPRSSDPRKTASVLARRAPFLRFAPVVCTSAKTGFQVLRLIEQAAALATLARKKLTSDEVRTILELLRNHPRAPVGLRNAHLIRLSQAGIAPPVFHLMARTRGRFSGGDAVFLENLLREQGGFQGVPVRVRFLVKRR